MSQPRLLLRRQPSRCVGCSRQIDSTSVHAAESVEAQGQKRVEHCKWDPSLNGACIGFVDFLGHFHYRDMCTEAVSCYALVSDSGEELDVEWVDFTFDKAHSGRILFATRVCGSGSHVPVEASAFGDTVTLPAIDNSLALCVWQSRFATDDELELNFPNSFEVESSSCSRVTTDFECTVVADFSGLIVATQQSDGKLAHAMDVGINCFAMDYECQWLAAAFANGDVCVASIETGAILCRIPSAHKSPPGITCILPLVNALVTAGADQCLRIWDLSPRRSASARELQRIAHSLLAEVLCESSAVSALSAAALGCGEVVCVGTVDGTVFLYALRTLTAVCVIQLKDSPLASISTMSDGTPILACGQRNGVVTLFDVSAESTPVQAPTTLPISSGFPPPTSVPSILALRIGIQKAKGRKGKPKPAVVCANYHPNCRAPDHFMVVRSDASVEFWAASAKGSTLPSARRCSEDVSRVSRCTVSSLVLPSLTTDSIDDRLSKLGVHGSDAAQSTVANQFNDFVAETHTASKLLEDSKAVEEQCAAMTEERSAAKKRRRKMMKRKHKSRAKTKAKSKPKPIEDLLSAKSSETTPLKSAKEHTTDSTTRSKALATETVSSERTIDSSAVAKVKVIAKRRGKAKGKRRKTAKTETEQKSGDDAAIGNDSVCDSRKTVPMPSAREMADVSSAVVVSDTDSDLQTPRPRKPMGFSGKVVCQRLDAAVHSQWRVEAPELEKRAKDALRKSGALRSAIELEQSERKYDYEAFAQMGDVSLLADAIYEEAAATKLRTAKSDESQKENTQPNLEKKKGFAKKRLSARLAQRDFVETQHRCRVPLSTQTDGLSLPRHSANVSSSIHRKLRFWDTSYFNAV